VAHTPHVDWDPRFNISMETNVSDERDMDPGAKEKPTNRKCA